MVVDAALLRTLRAFEVYSARLRMSGLDVQEGRDMALRSSAAPKAPLE